MSPLSNIHRRNCSYDTKQHSTFLPTGVIPRDDGQLITKSISSIRAELRYEAVQLLNLHIKYCHKTEPYNWKLHSPAIFWPYPIAINYVISRQSTSRPQSRSLDPVPTIWCGATGARWSPAKYIFIRGAAKLFAAHWLLQHVALRVSHYLCIGGENGTLPRPPDIPALGCTSHVFGTTRLLYVNQFSHKLIRRLFLSTNTNPTCVSFTPVTLHLGMLA